MYVISEGVPEDYIKAHMWASLAKTQRIERSAKILDSNKSLMTPGQVAKAQEIATEMWEKIND
jgi:hypothetical protein